MKKQTLCCTLALTLGIALMTLALWLCAAHPALADPIERYVAETGTDGSNDCKNPASPCRTIQHAIDVANPEDAVHVAGGTYTSTAGPVAVITKPLAIVGGFDPAFTYPDPRVYQLAVDRLGVSKDRISFQSSNAWDAVGAATFGFHVAWINRFGQGRERLTADPQAEIKTLDQLLPIVGA